ncbi:MAG TPA: hypothetical protein VJZ71_14775 [Phycisphaerae bacterium]|nr:hypothetical protein [Phycisphaerae bacterium]
MDHETLERLLIDRQLGELPPDTQRLLEAYMQLSPADAGTSEEIHAVIDVASQALRAEPPPTPEELPPLSLSAPQASSRRLDAASLKPQASRARPLALAASIVLAFLLGTRWVQQPDAPMDRKIQIADALSSSSLKPQAPSLVDAEFWSVARYAANRARPQSADRQSVGADQTRIEWTSPLVWPQSGEKL